MNENPIIENSAFPLSEKYALTIKEAHNNNMKYTVLKDSIMEWTPEMLTLYVIISDFYEPIARFVLF